MTEGRSWIRRKAKYPPLSDRQKQALAGFWLGETQAQTGERLGISAANVNACRRIARLKLQCTTTLDACKKAVRLGLIKGNVAKQSGVPSPS